MVLDSWSSSQVQPTVDHQQDVTHIKGSEVASITVLQFTRKLLTGDTADYDLRNTDFYLVWALGSTDGYGQLYAQHYVTGSSANLVRFDGSTTTTTTTTTTTAAAGQTTTTLPPLAVPSRAADFSDTGIKVGLLLFATDFFCPCHTLEYSFSLC